MQFQMPSLTSNDGRKRFLRQTSRVEFLPFFDEFDECISFYGNTALDYVI